MERVLTDSKALVTGGAGFIGSNLVESLLYRGNGLTYLDFDSKTSNHCPDPDISKSVTISNLSDISGVIYLDFDKFYITSR